jgi:hypothetical protein
MRVITANEPVGTTASGHLLKKARSGPVDIVGLGRRAHVPSTNRLTEPDAELGLIALNPRSRISSRTSANPGASATVTLGLATRFAQRRGLRCLARHLVLCPEPIAHEVAKVPRPEGAG